MLDAGTLRQLATLPAGREPETAVSSPDGKWVAVSAIDTRTHAVVRRVKAGTLPWGVAIVDVP